MYRISIAALVLACVVSTRGFGQMPLAPLQELPRLIQHLKDPSIRAELDLTDEQIGEVEALIEFRQQVMGTLSNQLRSLPVEKRREAFNSAHAEMVRLEGDVFKILLPFQSDRLRQIDYQLVVRADSASGGLTHKRLVEALGLTAAQEDAIREDLKKVEAELKEKIDALRKEMVKAKEEARQKTLKHLTEEQREAYLKLVGRLIDREND